MLNILMVEEEITTELETTTVTYTLSGTKATVGLSVFAYRIICIAVIIVFSLILLFILSKLFKKYFSPDSAKGKKISKERITVARVLYSVLRFVILGLAILCILSALGVNVTAAVAGLGIAGAVGALAVQDLLKDLITGANIASEQYFAIGDVIQYDDFIGTVIGLSMRSTKLKGLDGSIITIQNHMISKVKKLSREHKVIVPLSYELKREDAYALCDRLVDVISALPNIDSCKTSGIENFADSCIEYTLLFYCDPASPSTRRAVNVAIIDELDRSNIQIPYDKLEVINNVESAEKKNQ